ncbi:MAG TPA: putative sulfate exporter family transporter, partial [Candidatus Elarobacter sp.]|nr:putative sulfate exporter family transporter [Candidatus Elarobacter sp.]
GLAFSARTVLQAAIVVSGFGLSLAVVARTGLSTLPVTLGTITVALVLAPLLGRLLRIGGTLRLLVGVGTAICGASAIAAVSSVIEPEEAEIALAIATVFFYNIVAVLVFPPIGHALQLSQEAFGLWAGTAINDTSSVVAAGYAYGREAGDHATIVKLTRATLILPIVAAIALWRARQKRGDGMHVPWRRIIPWFILWFLVAALVNTTGIIPGAWHAGIGMVAIFLISIALAAIGLQTDLARLLRTGARPLALGFLLWIAVALSSLAIQRATGL